MKSIPSPKGIVHDLDHVTDSPEQHVVPVDVLSFFLSLDEEQGPVNLFNLTHILGVQIVSQFLMEGSNTFFLRGEFPGLEVESSITVIPSYLILDKDEIREVFDHAQHQVRETHLSVFDPELFPDGASHKMGKLVDQPGNKFKLRLFSMSIDGVDSRPVGGMAFHMAGKKGFPTRVDYGDDPFKAWTSFAENGGVVHLFSIPKTLLSPVAMIASELKSAAEVDEKAGP